MIRTGSTVRITRTAPNGKVRFVKSGTVGSVSGEFFEFTEDASSGFPGTRRYVDTDESLAVHMKGWTQTTEEI